MSKGTMRFVNNKLPLSSGPNDSKLRSTRPGSVTRSHVETKSKPVKLSAPKGGMMRDIWTK